MGFPAGDDLLKYLTKIGWLLTVASVDPASISAGATGTVNVTLAGVTPGHRCFAFPQGTPSAGGAVASGAVCSTAGTVVVTYSNPSAGAIDLTAHNVAVLAIPPLS